MNVHPIAAGPGLQSKPQQPWFVSGGVPNYHQVAGSRSSGGRRAGLQSRHVIIAACFLATFIAYVERTGFSVAYTAAAKERKLDEAVKGTVLSSFFWGYALSQVLCSQLPLRCVMPDRARECAGRSLLVLWCMLSLTGMLGQPCTALLLPISEEDLPHVRACVLHLQATEALSVVCGFRTKSRSNQNRWGSASELLR